MINLVPRQVRLWVRGPLKGYRISWPRLNDIRDEEDTTSKNESRKGFGSKGSSKHVGHGIPPVTKEGPIPALFPFFGNPAISNVLTRGFASPPHGGFALIGKGP